MKTRMVRCVWVSNPGQMEYGKGAATHTAPITPKCLKRYGNYSDQRLWKLICIGKTVEI